MSPAPTLAWLNGRIVPWSEACLPIEDRGLQFGESLYEVLMVTASRPRLLEEHVARMQRGADALDIARGVPPPAAWERIAAELISRESLVEGLLYAQVTGGAGPRVHVPPTPYAPNFFAYVRAHRFPRAEDAERGIAVITLPDARWDHSDLKTTMLLPALLAKREATKRGVDEALLVGPDGNVREGTTSNVFLVESGRILSPAQDRHLLPGTMRSLAESVAAEAGWTVESATIPLARLLGGGEVFLTSTSRLVMPVLRVDGTPIGPGTAGPVASTLARLLRERLEIDPA